MSYHKKDRTKDIRQFEQGWKNPAFRNIFQNIAIGMDIPECSPEMARMMWMRTSKGRREQIMMVSEKYRAPAQQAYLDQKRRERLFREQQRKKAEAKRSNKKGKDDKKAKKDGDTYYEDNEDAYPEYDDYPEYDEYDQYGEGEYD